MDVLSFPIFCILVGLVAAQTVLVVRFLAALLATSTAKPLVEYCPKAAVVVCLRGPDPFLVETLQSVFRQDYPEFDVKIVVDRCDDPAWDLAERAIAESGPSNVEIHPLERRRQTCGLKCSSLLQAIGSLDESYQVVAFLDADTIPHPRWLRELVAPLTERAIGVTTGNRWYMPKQVTLGGLMRYLWNVGAVAQMFAYHIPWGGTLAIRRDALQRIDLEAHWGRAFCEDTMLYKLMRDIGLRVAFVPSLMMVNREAEGTIGFVRWMTRQMLTSRLYHPRWGLIVLHGLFTSLAIAVAGVLAVGEWTGGDNTPGVWAGAGFIFYLAAMLIFIFSMEYAVRTVARRRGETTQWLSLPTVVCMPAAIVLTQFVYCGAVLHAILMRRVEWRGVSYAIDGPWRIRVLSDKRYEPSEAAAGSLKSL